MSLLLCYCRKSHQIVVKPPAAMVATLISLAEDVLTVAPATFHFQGSAHIFGTRCKKKAEYWLQHQQQLQQRKVRAKSDGAKCHIEASTLTVLAESQHLSRFFSSQAPHLAKRLVRSSVLIRSRDCGGKQMFLFHVSPARLQL